MPEQVRARTGMGRGLQTPRLRGIDLFNAAQKANMAKKEGSRKVVVDTKEIERPKIQCPVSATSGPRKATKPIKFTKPHPVGLPPMPASTLPKSTALIASDRDAKTATEVIEFPKVYKLPPMPASTVPQSIPSVVETELASFKTFKAIQQRLSEKATRKKETRKKETPEEYRARRAASAARKVAGATEEARPSKMKALKRERQKQVRAVQNEFHKRCRENELCLNCGWPGHMKKKCPDPPYVPVWSEDGQLSFEAAKDTDASHAKDDLTSDEVYDYDAEVLETIEEN